MWNTNKSRHFKSAIVMNASALGLNKVAAEGEVCVASKRKSSDCISFKFDYLDYKNLVFAHRAFLYDIKKQCISNVLEG